jgi:anti-sigma factor RsiW
MNHYDEMELLEEYYVPGASAAVARHVTDCPECSARLAAIDRQLRNDRESVAATVAAKTDTFWKRQQLAIQRKLEAKPRARSWRLLPAIAAAVFIALFAGAVAWQHAHRTPAVVSAAAEKGPIVTQFVPPEETVEQVRSSDPWDSDELRDLHEIVAWESWSDKASKQSKGTS